MLIILTLLSLLTCCYATPPPGYVKPPETDKNPPKYQYGYNIGDNKGSGQGKSESREGVFSLGRYYVELRGGGGPKGASQNVEYVTDEWGYHPFVMYSSVGDHSQASAQFALGEKAVEALRKNNQNQGNDQTNQNSFNRVQLSSSPLPTVSPTQTLPIQVHPSPIPSPPQLVQAPPNIQNKQPRILQHIPNNLPLYQNTIPLQYYYPQVNMPQAQFLIQQNIPTPQFLIQEQNVQQNQQFLIPVYHNNVNGKLNNHAESYVNINIPNPTQIYSNNVAHNLAQNTAQQEAHTITQNVNQHELHKSTQNHERKHESHVQNKIPNPTEGYTHNEAQNVEQNNQKLIENNAYNEEQNAENSQLNGAQNFIQNTAYNQAQKEAQIYAQNIAQTVSEQTGAQFLEQTAANINEEQAKQLHSELVIAQNEEQRNAEITAQISAEQTKQFENALAQNQQLESEKLLAENEAKELLKNIEITKEESKEQQKNSEEANKEIQLNGGVIQEQNQGYTSNLGTNYQQNIAVKNENIQTIYIHENNNKQAENINNVATNEQIQNNGYYALNQDVNSEQQYNTDTSDYNKGQYLIEVSQNSKTIATPNLVLLPQNTQHQQQNHQHFVNTKYSVQNNNINFDYIIRESPQRQQEENAALFGNTVSQIKYSTGERQNSYDESVLELEHPGGYGSRIQSKQPHAVKVQDYNINLIDRTKNLVTGVDVLNINDAVTNTAQGSSNEENSKENKNSSEYVEGTFEYNLPNTILQVINNEQVLQNSAAAQADYQNQGGQNNFQTHEEQDNYNSGNVVTSSSVSHRESETFSTASSFSSSALNSRTKLLEILNSEKIIPFKSEEDHISFADKPIIVADIDSYQDNSVQSTTASYKEISEGVYSTTQNTIETKITSDNYASTETPILITPRPVSNTFLAPITAAVSLQASGHALEELKKENDTPKGPYVNIQQSIPYYLGKIEFVDHQTGYSQSSEEETLSTKLFLQNVHESQENGQFLNVESGKHHSQIHELNSQVQEVSPQPISNNPQTQKLIQGSQNELLDQIPEQGQEISTSLDIRQHLSENIKTDDASENKFEQYGVYNSAEQPERNKIIEKHVPHPVEVEKIVEKTVHVPVEVTKYINNPYPVHIPYPQPVAVPVEVERLVQTIVKEPYPVEVPVPVEIKVPHAVHITKYVDKPYPVEKIIDRPITIEKIIEKPITKYVDKPYPVHIPHPVAVPIQITVPQPYPVEVTKYIDKPYGVPQPYTVHKTVNVPYVQHVPVAYPVTKLVQVPVEVPKYIERVVDRPYPVYFNLQAQYKGGQNPYLYAPKYQVDWKNLQNCEFGHQGENPKQGRFGKLADYIGLVPPLKPNSNFHNLDKNYKRRARNSFEQNLRIEYGFKPPIIPSIQTDEFGMPLKEE